MLNGIRATPKRPLCRVHEAIKRRRAERANCSIRVQEPQPIFLSAAKPVQLLGFDALGNWRAPTLASTPKRVFSSHVGAAIPQSQPQRRRKISSEMAYIVGPSAAPARLRGR